MISTLLERNLEIKDRYKANKAYDEFFDKLKEQKQNSISNVIGSISYIYTDDEKFEEVFENMKKKNGLIYIREKEGEFNTRKEKNIMTSILEQLLLENNSKKDDKDAFLYEKQKELENILSENKHLKTNFLDKYGIMVT